MSSSELIALRICPETVPGTTDVDSANWLSMCYTSEGLSLNPQYSQSQRICGGVGGDARLNRSRALTNATPGGPTSFEAMYSALLHLYLEAAMGSAWAADVLSVGTVFPTYTIEKEYKALTNKFEYFRGCVLNELSLAIPSSGEVTGTANWMARTHATGAASLVGAGSVTGEPTNAVYAGKDLSVLQFDSVTDSTIVNQGVNLTISNNFRPVTGTGQVGPQGHNSGTADIGGDIALYLVDSVFDQYETAIANGDVSLDFTLLESGNSLAFSLPQVNLDATPLSSPGRNQDVIPRFPFTSHSTSPTITRSP